MARELDADKSDDVIDVVVLVIERIDDPSMSVVIDIDSLDNVVDIRDHRRYQADAVIDAVIVDIAAAGDVIAGRRLDIDKADNDIDTVDDVVYAVILFIDDLGDVHSTDRTATTEGKELPPLRAPSVALCAGVGAPSFRCGHKCTVASSTAPSAE